MTTKLSLATINVADMQASLAFYRDVLGLPVSEQFEMEGMKIAMMGERDQARIELVELAQMPQGQLGVGCRYGFVTDDVQPILQRLNGDYIHPESPNPMFEFYYVNDPDGYLIEIMQPVE